MKKIVLLIALAAASAGAFYIARYTAYPSIFAAVVSGANYIVGACNATYNIGCTCGGTHVCFDRGQPDGSQCGTMTDNNGLCAVYYNSQHDTGGKQIYYCENDFSGKSCTKKLIPAIPSCYCGTIQVDTPGSGYKSYQSTCGCKQNKKTTPKPTPKPTPAPRPRKTPTPTPTPRATPTPTPTVTPTPTPPQVLTTKPPKNLPPTGFPIAGAAGGLTVTGVIGWFLARRARA